MFKRIIICILSFATVSGFACAQDSEIKPADPAKAALIEEMMSLTRPDKNLTQFLQQYKAAFSKGVEESFRTQFRSSQEASKYRPQLQKFEDQMFDLMADRMSWNKIKPKLVAIYDETFSKQELADIVAFYKTPSGQSLREKMPTLIAKGSQIGQAQMSGAIADIQRLTAEFIADLQKTQDKR